VAPPACTCPHNTLKHPKADQAPVNGLQRGCNGAPATCTHANTHNSTLPPVSVQLPRPQATPASHTPPVCDRRPPLYRLHRAVTDQHFHASTAVLSAHTPTVSHTNHLIRFHRVGQQCWRVPCTAGTAMPHLVCALTPPTLQASITMWLSTCTPAAPTLTQGEQSDAGCWMRLGVGTQLTANPQVHSDLNPGRGNVHADTHKHSLRSPQCVPCTHHGIMLCN
jgi:hypothetical protein